MRIRRNIPSFGFFVIMALMILVYFTGCETEESIYPEGRNTFLKLYGYGRLDVAADMIKNPDGGYVIVGTTFSGALADIEDWRDADNDVLVIFVDEGGNDARYYVSGDPNGNEMPHQVISTGNGRFAITGERISGGISNAFLMTIDQEGVLDWIDLEISAGFQSERGLSLIEYKDGELDWLVIGGETSDYSEFSTKKYYLLDAQGAQLDSLVSKNDSTLSKKLKNAIVNTNDGVQTEGFLSLDSIITVNGDHDLKIHGYYIVDNLAEISNNIRAASDHEGTFGIPADFEVYDPVELYPDILVMSNDGLEGNSIIQLGKYEVGDATQPSYIRNKILSKQLLFESNVTGINLHKGLNNFFLSGTDDTNNRIVIAMINGGNLEKVWDRTYGSGGYGLGGSIIENDDGSLVFCGTVDFQNENLKIALYKTNSNGELER